METGRRGFFGVLAGLAAAKQIEAKKPEPARSDIPSKAARRKVFHGLVIDGEFGGSLNVSIDGVSVPFELREVVGGRQSVSVTFEPPRVGTTFRIESSQDFKLYDWKVDYRSLAK